MLVNFATSSGCGFECQVALGRGQFRVAHHVLDGHDVELLNSETAEAVAQIVEAAHSYACLLLGTDEAGTDGGTIERAAIWPAEDVVGPGLKEATLPKCLQLRGGLVGERHRARAA